MSKQKEEARTQAPEKTWMVFAIQRSEGTYEQAGGWVLRAGEVTDAKMPSLEQTHERNLFGVVLARMSSIATWFRDHGR